MLSYSKFEASDLTKHFLYSQTKVDMGCKTESRHVLEDLRNRIIRIYKAGLKKSEIEKYYDLPRDTLKTNIRRSKANNNNDVTKK